MRTEKGMENAKAARAAYNREHIRSVGTTLRKEDAEAFRALAERQGTTPGAMLKRFVLNTLADERSAHGATESTFATPEVAVLSHKNFERLKRETAFHNPRNFDPNGLLNHILNNYFKMADEIRAE